MVSNPSRHVAILSIYRITESNDSSAVAGTSYAVRPQSSIASGVLRARFGAIGSVTLRFQPHGKNKVGHLSRHCHGRAPQTESGEYRGTVSLRGEDGYFRHPPRFTAILNADHETGGRGVHFEALRFARSSRPPAHRAFYAASVNEQLGPIRVIRQIRTSGPTSTFLLPNFATAPENAAIQPPPPFTGSGTFARTPESTFSWTGDLAITFPGIDPLPLTGSDFRLHYCALYRCIDQEPPSEGEGPTS